MHIRVLALFLLLFLHELAVARPLQVSVSVPSAILINAKNGKILFAKNIDDAHAPGSVTKIATFLVALQRIQDMDEPVKAPLECLIQIPQKIKQERHYQDPPYRLEPDGTSYGIYTGEVLTIKELLYGLVLPSGNDAANVLAYHFSQGDIPAYMEDVNQYVASLGCHHTKFYNPHGLHHPQHMTTARDLARLGQEAIKHKEFLEVMQTVEYERPKTNKQPARTIWTRNHLLRRGKFYYPKAFGIKSGYHKAAGHVFVGAAQDDHRVLISVVMHANSKEEMFRETIKLFEAAFGEKPLTRQLLNHQESIFTTRIQGTKKSLKARLHEDLLLEYFPSEEEEMTPQLLWYPLKLPIQQGEKVGELHVVTESGLVLKTVPIYAMETLPLPFLQKALKWSRSWQGMLSILLASQIFTAMYLYRYFRRPKQAF